MREERSSLTRPDLFFFKNSASAGFAGSDDTGTSGAQFLKISPGARASSLGGASAVIGGAEGLYYNPAGLFDVEEFEATLTQIAWLGDIRYSNAAAAKRYKSGVYGFAFNYLTVPPITKYNNRGERLAENYALSDMALTFGYSRSIVREELRVGGSLKYISSSIENASASSFAIDMGGRYTLIPNICELGASLQNLGAPLKYVSKSAPLPLNLKLGGKYNFIVMDEFAENQGLLTYTDLNYTNDPGPNASLGVEFYRDLLEQKLYYALRAGYNTDFAGEYGGLAFGFGVQYLKYVLDYAFVGFGDLGQTHRISLSLKLGVDEEF